MTEERTDREVCGVQMYNCALTGDVAMTITGQRVDCVNEPVVIIKENGAEASVAGQTDRCCIICDPLGSNSMKSRNPHSGFHQEEYSVTLDTSSQNPIRNGGGMLVVEW